MGSVLMATVCQTGGQCRVEIQPHKQTWADVFACPAYVKIMFTYLQYLLNA